MVCDDPKVISRDEQGREICFMGPSCPFNSVMKTNELLYQGYIVHWCDAINTQPKEEKAEDIPIVCEFREVFRRSYQDCSA